MWWSKDSKREDSKGKKTKNFVKDNIKNIGVYWDLRVNKNQTNLQKSLTRVEPCVVPSISSKGENIKISEYRKFIKRQKQLKINNSNITNEVNKSLAEFRK